MKSNNSIKKLIPIIGILLVLIAVIVVMVFLDNNPNNSNVGEENQTPLYDYIKNGLDEYNNTADIKLKVSEENNELIFSTDSVIDDKHGMKCMLVLNYTNSEMGILEYDKELKPTRIISMKIDSNYNISEVLVYTYGKEKVDQYKAGDKEVEPFITTANIMVDIVKNMYKGTDKDVFNKSIAELKETMHNK